MKANSLATDSAGSVSPGVAWHALPEIEVTEKLEASLSGLTDVQLAERQREFGRNVLPAKKPPTALLIFLRQFLSPLIYILLAVGILAIFMGDVTDAALAAIADFREGVAAFSERRAARFGEI